MYNIINNLINNIETVIIGKRKVVQNIVVAMLCNGHVLLEDVPGVGKTQLVSALAKSINGKFNRIQLTPDIMPSDIVGYTMINQQTGVLEYRPGVAICNILLADEINRASPKVQSSLLEVMEESQISIEGRTIALPKPFMCLATQNPVETYGTYHLPEAQMDRFLMKVSVGYPDIEDEMRIIKKFQTLAGKPEIKAVLSINDLIKIQDLVNKVMVNDNVIQYILNIIAATRESEFFKLGVSPRGSLALFKAARAKALVNGRNFVTPDDVNTLAVNVLAHRIILSPKGKSYHVKAENAIEDILKRVVVPV